ITPLTFGALETTSASRWPSLLRARSRSLHAKTLPHTPSTKRLADALEVWPLPGARRFGPDSAPTDPSTGNLPGAEPPDVAHDNCRWPDWRRREKGNSSGEHRFHRRHVFSENDRTLPAADRLRAVHSLSAATGTPRADARCSRKTPGIHPDSFRSQH